MNRSLIRILIHHELRMLLRDRRTLLLSVFLPLLITPGMIYGIKITSEWREEKQEETVYRYALTGSRAEQVRALLSRAAPSDDFRIAEIGVANPESSLFRGDLHFFLICLNEAESDSAEAYARAMEDTSRSESSDDSAGVAPVKRYPGVPMVIVHYSGNRDESSSGSRRMRRLLFDIRKMDRETMLHSTGFSSPAQAIVPVDTVDVATREQVTGSYLGRFMTVFLVFLMLSGASVVAMDSIAGEKERGSLETLLTTSVSRFEIVLSKQLTTLIVAMVIVCIHILNLLAYISFRVIDLPETIQIHLPPAVMLLLFALYLPVAASISSLLLMISAYAKSYRETQWYYLPAFFGLAFLALAAVLPAVPLRSVIALVPIANVGVAARDILVGSYDPLMLVVVFLAMSGTAVLLMRASTRMLSMERLITGSEEDEADLTGGPALFQKRALLWFVGMWGVMLIVSTNISFMMKFEGQYVFNQFVLFLAVPLFLIRLYRMDYRTALALRPVKRAVWPLVAIMIPATHLTGIGVFHLANLVFPVPEKMLEDLTRFMAPPEYPFWLIVVMLSVVPGIVEELSFRGLLLFGLSKKYHPVAVALMVGAVFGLFHTSLYRIIPTGFLGVILTGVALMTGSVFPGMLLHAGNNALAFLLYHYGVRTDQLVWWYYLLGVTAFALCLYMIYRNRTPYPGLRRRAGKTGL